MTLLDTDTFTHYSRGRPQVCRRVDAAPSGEVALPLLVRLEVLRGRIDAVRKADKGGDVLRMQQKLADAEAMLAKFPVVLFDEAAAALFDQLAVLKALRGVGRIDLMIASIARSRNATLVTRNLKDFALVPGLRVENWAD